MRAGTPAHPGCMWFSVPGSWFSVRDARAPGMRRIARMRAGRPRTQGARGSRFLVPGSRFGTPAHPGTRRIARMRAGTPAHPGGMWFSVPGSWFSVRDARAPRGHVVLGSRFGTPAHPGGTWFSVLGSWFSVLGSWFLVLGSWFLVLDSGRPHTQGRSGLRVCGRDARAPGTRRIARMRAGRPRTQGARGSPLLQGWYGIGARRVPGCPIAVRPVHATFRDGKQKPRTRSPQLPGAVWRARPAQ